MKLQGSASHANQIFENCVQFLWDRENKILIFILKDYVFYIHKIDMYVCMCKYYCNVWGYEEQHQTQYPGTKWMGKTVVT
jgi:hypothetical protein